MPVRFSVGFIPERPILQNELSPERIHGLFFSIIGNKLAEELHKPSKIKPFCIGIPNLLKESNKFERIFLRISLLDENLFPRVLSSILLNNEDIYISGIKLRKILKPFIDERWIKSYDSLVKHVKPDKTIIFDFKTPTSFKKGDKDYPIPDPTLIFKSLIRKWCAFSPIPINVNLRNAINNDIEIMGVWIRTKKISFSKVGKLTGFVGRVVFYIDSEDIEIIKWINILGKFSEFAGIGRKTTMGFGMVRFTNTIAYSSI